MNIRHERSILNANFRIGIGWNEVGDSIVIDAFAGTRHFRRRGCLDAAVTKLDSVHHGKLPSYACISLLGDGVRNHGDARRKFFERYFHNLVGKLGQYRAHAEKTGEENGVKCLIQFRPPDHHSGRRAVAKFIS